MAFVVTILAKEQVDKKHGMVILVFKEPLEDNFC